MAPTVTPSDTVHLVDLPLSLQLSPNSELFKLCKGKENTQWFEHGSSAAGLFLDAARADETPIIKAICEVIDNRALFYYPDPEHPSPDEDVFRADFQPLLTSSQCSEGQTEGESTVTMYYIARIRLLRQCIPLAVVYHRSSNRLSLERVVALRSAVAFILYHLPTKDINLNEAIDTLRRASTLSEGSREHAVSLPSRPRCGVMECPHAHGSIDNVSILQLISTLHSPPAPATSHVIPGLRLRDGESPLFEYQRAAVADMIQRESNPSPSDPECFETADGTQFHIHRFGHARQLADDFRWMSCGSEDHVMALTDVRDEDPRWSQQRQTVRGGVLCEYMGSGKTLELLALIAATHDLPSTTRAIPPPLEVDLSTPASAEPGEVSTTEVAPPRPPHRFSNATNVFSHLWVESHTRRLPPEYQLGLDEGVEVKPMSLIQLAAQALNETMPAHHAMNKGLPSDLAPIVKWYSEHPRLYDEGVKIRKTSRLSTIQEFEVSHATLILVPTSLFDAWKGEVNKFLCTHLVAGDENNWSRDRYGCNLEFPVLAVDAATEKLWATTEAAASPEGLVNGYDIVLVPLERMSAEESFLFEVFSTIHWKRIIVDEGHRINKGRQTYSRKNISRLRADFTWISTGTPAPGERPLDSLRNTLSLLGHPMGRDDEQWRMLKQEFAYQEKHYDQQVVSTRVLQHSLKKLCVRNRENDVAQEAKIPSMTEETVKLKFAPHERISYDYIVAAARANIISSRGEGVDSLLDASNTHWALTNLTNLKFACFFFEPLENNRRENLNREIVKTIRRTYDPPLLASEREELCLLNTATQLQPAHSLDNFLNATITRTGDVRTSSTKATYVLRELANAVRDSRKTIVFSDSPDQIAFVESIIFHLQEDMKTHADRFANLPASCPARHLQQLKYVLYHKQIKPQTRNQSLITFQTSDETLVIFMQLSLAAEGINLNRGQSVVFMEPVSDQAKRQQAIARAHRIGQVNPVTVKFLVMEDTIEEDLHRRRTRNRAENLQSVREVLSKMRLRLPLPSQEDITSNPLVQFNEATDLERIGICERERELKEQLQSVNEAHERALALSKELSTETTVEEVTVPPVPVPPPTAPGMPPIFTSQSAAAMRSLQGKSILDRFSHNREHGVSTKVTSQVEPMTVEQVAPVARSPSEAGQPATSTDDKASTAPTTPVTPASRPGVHFGANPSPIVYTPAPQHPTPSPASTHPSPATSDTTNTNMNTPPVRQSTMSDYYRVQATSLNILQLNAKTGSSRGLSSKSSKRATSFSRPRQKRARKGK